MTTHRTLLKCPDCWRHFNTDDLDELRDHRYAKHNVPRPDGGQLTLNGDLKYRVVWTSGGVEFQSEPLNETRAREYADAIGDATVTVDHGDRPLADNQRASLEPVEVEQ